MSHDTGKFLAHLPINVTSNYKPSTVVVYIVVY